MVEPVSAKVEELEPVTRGLCEAFLRDSALAGLALRVTHTLRTMDEQAHLYAKGRTMPGAIVTHARPGESAHNYGMAFDICFAGQMPYPPIQDIRWEHAGRIGEALGLVWGGRWKKIQDRPHFERFAWKEHAARVAQGFDGT